MNKDTESHWQIDEDAALLWRFAVNASGQIAAGTEDLVFTWCHLQCDLIGASAALREIDLPPTVVEALTEHETRPRVTSLAGGTLLILRGVNKNPGSDPEDMIGIRCWFDDRRIITTRRKSRALIAVRTLRERYQTEGGPGDIGNFIAELAELLADRIGEFVDTLEDNVAAEESRLLDAGYMGNRAELAEMRREAAAVRRYLAPQRDALDGLLRERDLLDENAAHILRQQSDRTTRYVEDLDLARERTLLMQEEQRSRLAEQQNARMYVLSLVTAIFLPLSFLTGVFGVNVDGMPGTSDPNAFLVLSGAMLGIAILLLVFMRWRRWL